MQEAYDTSDRELHIQLQWQPQTSSSPGSWEQWNLHYKHIPFETHSKACKFKEGCCAPPLFCMQLIHNHMRGADIRALFRQWYTFVMSQACVTGAKTSVHSMCQFQQGLRAPDMTQTAHCQEGRRLTFSKTHGPVFHHRCLRVGQGCSLLSAGLVLLQGLLPVTHLFQHRQLSQPMWTNVPPASTQTDTATTYTCPCRLRSLLCSFLAAYTVTEMRKVLRQESRGGKK